MGYGSTSFNLQSPTTGQLAPCRGVAARFEVESKGLKPASHVSRSKGWVTGRFHWSQPPPPGEADDADVVAEVLPAELRANV
jgi:hypothetical protein